MSWISELITAITDSFSGIGDAIITFLKDGFMNLFFDLSETGTIDGISEFGIFSFVLMGISLALGLTYFVVNLVRRKI